MSPSTREDFIWLMSEEAVRILAKVQTAFEDRINAVRIAKRLRLKTTPQRSALVMEQAQLRIRAKKKFSHPEGMFFTRKGLEQSSGKLIARYKGMRFAGISKVADVCSGIGGDLIGLAKRDSFDGSTDAITVGVDLDEVTCLFARRNIEVSGFDSNKVTVEQIDFADFDIGSFDAIHFDPDRRTKDRTVRGNHFSPSLSSVFERVTDDCSISIKVAPATPLASYFPRDMEREWIGDHRECKQQILWTGPATVNPGHRTATYIGRDGGISQVTIDESNMDQTIEVFDSIHQYIYEPHPTVLASGLTDVLANRYGLKRFTASIIYLTGDQLIDDPLLSRFEVLQILPISLRQTAKILDKLEVGLIEVKKRGIENVTVEQYKRLKLDGPNKATVILTRLGKTRISVIAKRPENDLHFPDVGPSEADTV